jgi:hypothetical protein
MHDLTVTHILLSFHIMSLTIIFAHHLLVDTKHLQEFSGVLPTLKFEGKNRVCVVGRDVASAVLYSCACNWCAALLC